MPSGRGTASDSCRCCWGVSAVTSFLLVLTDIGAAYIFQVELYKVSNIHEMCWDCRAVRFFVQFAMWCMWDSLWKNTFAGWLSWLFPQLLPWPTFIGTRQRKMETMQFILGALNVFPTHRRFVVHIDKVQYIYIYICGQRDGLRSRFFRGKLNVKQLSLGFLGSHPLWGRGLMAALGTTRAWIAGAMSSTRGGWKDVCVCVCRL